MLTYAIQRVGYDHDQTDPQGATDLASFLKAIDTFPWISQHRKWDVLQEGPFPGLVLQNAADQRELWVTALGKDEVDGFQLISVAMRTRKGFFGKVKVEQDTTVVEVDSRSAVDGLCELFSTAQYEALDREVARLA